MKQDVIKTNSSNFCIFYTNGITSDMIPLAGKLLHSRIAEALRTVMSCIANCLWSTPSQVMQKLEAVKKRVLLQIISIMCLLYTVTFHRSSINSQFLCLQRSITMLVPSPEINSHKTAHVPGITQ